ncbi:CLK4-associating serine/arginine rich protein isoform X6 [Esox lucius]|uniref:CLK4-associating serine/arginine rich protein isoform X6 n=1 Tax=Esox lucius TaxID=8010 RepID=UPI001476D972|nr:CLK4-associating serine/arginine rich protein isoform X6 [Esox lucius]
MWQEARKHERKLRGMMVDYKRRGERRREYYEKIKKDPAQFLQVHGRAYKIHLDSAVALAAESPINMMPWQGDTNNMIDRFDVRAHLDYIPTFTPPLLSSVTPEQESEERKCNYERYRGLVQNDFASISEEQCLYQIQMDELYGGLQRPNEDEKKKLAKEKATIGYTYEDSTVTEPGEEEEKGEEDDSENSESEEDEGIPDIDVEVDVDELNTEQELDLNKMATPYGMSEGDFVRMLRKDKDEVEAIKHAKALEAEKAMYSGRRSRRQRREFREKRLKGRQISPPSYARRDSPTYDPYKRPQSESSSESRSRSRSPGPEKITFITSFGGSDEEAATATQAPPPVHSGHTPANSLHHPADAALPPAPPLPLAPPPMAPPLVPPLAPAATRAAEEAGTGGIPAPGRDGARTRGLAAGELTGKELGHGGDTTGHGPAPMTETGTGTETGRWTGDGTGMLGVDSPHAEAHDPAQTLGRGSVPGGGVGGVLLEATEGGSAVAPVPPSPPSSAAPPHPPTKEGSPLPLLSVTS